jgi:hypothetical protein
MVKQKVRGLIGLVLLISWAMSGLSGLILYLAPTGRRSGQALLLLEMTKHEWADYHTWSSFLAVGVTVLHVIVDWKILVALVKCLVKGKLPAKS